MRLPAWKTLLTGALLALPTGSGAMRMLQSTSLNQCDGSTTSGFTATLFNVVFTPDNGTLSYNINAISSISQKVVAQLNVIAYGLVAINKTIDPCKYAPNPHPLTLRVFEMSWRPAWRMLTVTQ